jgi:hypothetical protein
MSTMIKQLGGTTVLMATADGPTISREADVLDLIGEALHHEAHWVVVPVGRLAAEFFSLGSGLAGGVLQKFVNYRICLAVLGDIAEYTADSGALRDLVRETNRGRQAWFVPDLEDLEARLSRLYRPSGS